MFRVTDVVYLVLVCASIKTCIAQNGTEETPELITPLGKLKGSYMTSRLGKKIYSFRGIRYAEPPTGQQRFQPPIPAIPWDFFDASEEGPSCPQIKNTILQSEDCLRLNVYTTKISTALEIVKRSVIVFFHPGSLVQNSGQSIIYGPEYLLDHDIVLVTVNYRLASLGFMSTGDSLLPGNLGLKDQVEALRWVQKNIAAFGGNSHSVTIAGYGAGAYSVSLHMVSPMSKGLFHRAIGASGSAFLQEPLPTNQTDLAKKQAELLGCPTDATGNMLVCLYTKTADEFVQSIDTIFTLNEKRKILWFPVIEPEVRGIERFLPAQPIDLIKQGKFYRVPYLTGVTKNELEFLIIDIIEQAQNGNNSEIQDLNEKWYTFAPMNFLYESNTEHSKIISDQFKKYYLHNEAVSVENVLGIGKLYSDGIINFPVHRLVNLLVEASDQPVYYYEYVYQGSYSYSYWNNTKKPYGVVHQDDLLNIFHTSSFPEFEKNSSDYKMIDCLTTIWSNFAITGKPLTNENIFGNVSWEKFTTKNKEYLEIGSELVMKTNLNEESMRVWNELFPLKDDR